MGPQTHKMAPWVRRVFIHILPRLLAMRRPQCRIDEHAKFGRHVVVRTCNGSELHETTSRRPSRATSTFCNELPRFGSSSGGLSAAETLCRVHGFPTSSSRRNSILVREDPTSTHLRYLGTAAASAQLHSGHHAKCTADLHRSCFCVRFIAEHTRLKEESLRVREDWKYVAMVLDRLFLWIFTLAVLVGTAAIILQAPSLYDDREPIDKQLSEIFSIVRNRHQT